MTTFLLSDLWLTSPYPASGANNFTKILENHDCTDLDKLLLPMTQITNSYLHSLYDSQEN